MDDTVSLMARINDWERRNPIKSDHLRGRYSKYTFRPWVLEKMDYNSDTGTYTFVISNKSSGYYVARPWMEKHYDGQNYTIVPRTKIEVGSIPAMRLQSRYVLPNNRNTQPVDVFRGYRDAAPSSVIKYYRERYANIKSIVINGKRVYNFPRYINNKANLESFLENARIAIRRYIERHEKRKYDFE